MQYQQYSYVCTYVHTYIRTYIHTHRETSCTEHLARLLTLCDAV
jgi:hypothetical protein